MNSIMAVEQAPITRIQAQERKNSDQNTSLTELQTDLTTLQLASTALAAPDLFAGRTAASTTAGSSWIPIASTGTPVGNYQIAVSQLATASTLTGTSGVSGPISPTNIVSALTVANLHTASSVTAGFFTVNGRQVPIALTDSLAQVFTAISTATAGAVTASYDSTTDKITLSSTGVIVLGAANDTSNFLPALNLGNNGTATVTSSGKVGALNLTSTLAGAGLRTAVTAVDASGNGTFSINGVSISYNLNTSTIGSVITTINQSKAGVTAGYDATSDRFTLTNAVTGDTGIAVSEASGGLMGAFGLASGTTLTHGTNAQYSVNGGPTRTSASNSLNAASLGIPGLGVTVNSLGTQTIAVSGSTNAMSTAIANFLAAFNTIQTYLTTNTTNTVAGTTVTPGLLSGNREIQSWGTTLRSKIFAAVPGMTGTISRLNDLGIDFTPGTSQLSVTNTAKLSSALANNANDVAAFFQTTTTGMADQITSYVATLLTANTQQQATLTKSNADLDTQIATIQRQLDQQKAQLTASFVAMESAQSLMQSQLAALNSAFGNSSTSTSSMTGKLTAH